MVYGGSTLRPLISRVQIGKQRAEAKKRMWQESEAAIGDLLASETLRSAGRLDEPTTVSGWWADRGIKIESQRIDRKFLFAMADRVRSQADPDWVCFLWHVFAWGVMGDFRNVSGIAKRAADQGQRSRLNEILAAAAGASEEGDIRKAYRSLYKKVPNLGPAFFTKFLYFTGDRRSADPQCLILDSRVSYAIFALTGLDFFAEKATTYEGYCQRVAQWSKDYGAASDEIEFRLYQLGQRIDSARWKWLRAEVSLYRSGATDVEFEDILRQLEVMAGREAH